MSTRLDEVITTPTPDKLINGVYPPADVFSVVIRKGTAAATYERGTVLALSGGSGGDGKHVILGTTAGTNEALTANAILADPVTVGTDADAVAVAYRTGHFNSNGLIVASGYTFKAADKEALRGVGILISDAVEA